MTITAKDTMRAERERRRWFVVLAFGVVDETVAVPPATPAPVTGDVLP